MKIVFLALLAVPAGLLAQEPAPVFVPERVVASVELVPERDGDYRFEYFRVEYLADGSRVLRGRTVTNAKIVSDKFFFEADLSRGTYRTFRQLPSPDTAAGAKPSDVAIDAKRVTVAAVPPRTRRTQSIQPGLPICDPETDNCGCGGCDDLCSGYWDVTVTEYDPLGLDLVHTTASGSWGVSVNPNPYPNMCQWRARGTGSCTAANPTEANTNWYTSRCERFGPFTSYKQFDLTAAGNYYNNNFLGLGQTTYVDHTARITLMEGIGVSVDWSYHESGAFGFLLSGSISQNGSNSCF